MRLAKLITASCLAASLLSACNDKTTPAAPDPAALAKATTEAVSAALAARDADDTKIHGDAGPGVYIVNLRDGETVSSPFRVVFGLYGAGIAPATPPGMDMGKKPAAPAAGAAPAPVTGHHHLLIDTEMSAEELKSAIPKDETHMHFGGGQTETVLQLPAGTHTLQLVLGDNMHTPANPPVMSKKITITVK